MIHYALNEFNEIDTNISSDRGYAVTYNIYFKGNPEEIVQEVVGEDIVKEISEVVTYMPCLYNSFQIPSEKPVKIALCTLHSYDLDTILKDISIINDTLKVKTNNKEYPIFSELTSSEIISAISK
jgi:hypothetical protein